MFIHPSGSAASGPAYPINNSLRIRSGAYLSRTPGATGDPNKLTFSFWMKRGDKLSSGQAFILTGLGSVGGRQTALQVANGVLYFDIDSNFSGAAQTSVVFRDPAAWYHVVFAYDSSLSIGSRSRIFVNGSGNLVTSDNTGGTSYWSSSGATMEIGRNLGGGLSREFDGYLAEMHFIDGQALTPSDFGLTDTNGNWQPKAYAGTYGSQGWYLKLNNATNLTTLAQDSSGNGNNWTANGVSLTAGATYDWMTDTPTNNFAVSNALDIDRANITTSNGNLTLTKGTDSVSPRAASSIGVTAGKWYCEVTWASLTDSAPLGNVYVTGVTTKEGWSDTSNGVNVVNYIAANAPSGLDGWKQVVTAGSAVNSTYGAGYFVNGTVIGIALDLNAGTVTFYKNGVSQGAITLPSTSEAWFPFCTGDGGNNAFTNHWNFGQRPFAHTPPSGFSKLCTANLPAPAISNPKLHFDIKTRIGTAASANITGYQFAPDLVWIKSRGRALSHALFDRLRGVQKMLESNQNSVETTETTGLTAFNADGYTIGALDRINGTTAVNSFVDWAWKAAGAAVANNAGSISSQVSANVAAGISILTYTGTGANATVGHGLGVAPKMLIVKKRDDFTNWPVYHADLTSAAWNLFLNTFAPQGNDTTTWNSTAPSASVFSVGGNGNSNANGASHVAYCFAEVPGFSRIGSYVGNGSANGPFVYCGFRPRWVLVKRISSGADVHWVLMDGQRSLQNVVDRALFPSNPNAEATVAVYDFTANGFKIQTSDGGANTSAVTYAFLAFAEAPLKLARAR